MIPIIKNIRVVDEQGKDYGATYPKRARGLVKTGRARFINDDVICLACPPNKIFNYNNDYLEDIKMSNDIFDNTIKALKDDNFEGAVKALKGFNYADNKESSKYNWEYALEKIEKISDNTEYIKEALIKIEAIGGDSIDGTGQAKAEAIREAVKSHEETNRKLIEFYRAMYDDLKPNKPNNSSKEIMQKMIVEKISNIDIGDVDDQPDFIEKLMRFAREI